MNKLRIAIVTTDKREHGRDYSNPVPAFGAAPEALLQGFAGRADAEVHVVSCTQKPLQSPESLAQNIFYHSLLVPKIGWLRTAYQGCIRAVRRRLRDLRPDIVHGQGTERDCALDAVFSGFPNVLTIHGNMRRIARIEHARPLSFLWSAAMLEQFSIPRSDGIVCISNYTRAAVQDLARRTWLVPNAVDSGFFSVQPQPRPLPRLACVATICGYKNQNFLIRSLDPLAQEAAFELVFLGGTIAGDAYGEEFRELLRTRPWCRHWSHVDRSTLRECLAGCHALVHPSLEDNCPMAVLEAMAAGVPVVASNIGGIPDLIEHDSTGLLLAPDSGAAWYEAVRQIVMNPSVSQERANRAREKARQTFHPEVVAAKHLTVYREILATRSSS